MFNKDICWRFWMLSSYCPYEQINIQIEEENRLTTETYQINEDHFSLEMDLYSIEGIGTYFHFPSYLCVLYYFIFNII